MPGYDDFSSLPRTLDGLKKNLALPETEELWEKISAALTSLSKICQQEDLSSDDSKEIVAFARSVTVNISSALLSERARLSGAAVDAVTTLATTLGSDFNALLPHLLPAVIQLTSRPNKVFIKRGIACLTTIIESTQLPGILTHLANATKDRSQSMRLAVTQGTLTCLNCFNPPVFEKENRAREIETVIKSSIRDANVDVRKAGREVFKAYQVLLPSRVPKFVQPLTPISLKYLDVKASSYRSAPTNSTSTDTTGTSRTHVSRTASTSLHPPKPTVTLSVSTSNVPTMANRVQLHARAASSSNVIETKPSAPIRRPPMPPPNHVPVRSAPSRQVSRPVSVASSRSAGGAEAEAPSRPRPAASRVVRPPSPPAPVKKGGALRLHHANPPAFKPTTSREGAQKAPEKSAAPGEGEARIKGGARRVPFPQPPPPPPPPATPSASTSEAAPVHPPAPTSEDSQDSSRADSPRGRAISRPPSRPASRPASPAARPRSRSAAPRKAEQSKEVPKGTVPKPAHHAAPGQFKPTSSKEASKAISSKPEAPSVPSKRGGVLQPTLSQLARSTTTRPLVPRKASQPNASAKPKWGGGPAPKPVLKRQPSGMLRKENKGGVKKPAVVVPPVPPIPEAHIPLPPSPPPAAAIELPLPESPLLTPKSEVELISETRDMVDPVQQPSNAEDVQEEVEVAIEQTAVEHASHAESANIVSAVQTPKTAVAPLPALDAPMTPISALANEIENGFHCAPSEAILSPPSKYSNLPVQTGAFVFGFGVQKSQPFALHKPTSVGFPFAISNEEADENSNPLDDHDGAMMKGDARENLKREVLAEVEGNA